MLALPVAFMVPIILAPVVVTTNTFATPPTEVLTLPFITGIDTRDVPFDSEPPPTVDHDSTPAPSVVST